VGALLPRAERERQRRGLGLSARQRTG
jgi:hypothetical protein